VNIDPQSDFHGFLAIATPIAVILAAVIQKLDARKLRKERDKSDLKRDTKLNTIHDLVDGNLGEQKRLNMFQASRIAGLTKDAADIALANEAKRLYEDHQARMLRIDEALAKERQSWP
jgi:hypothetical protein